MKVLENPTATNSSRGAVWNWSCVVLIPLLLVGLHWHWQQLGLAFQYDTNLYLAGAESFAQGHGYHLTNFAGEPPIGLYPPLHSFFLSQFWSTALPLEGNLQRLSSGMLLLDGTALGVMLWLMLRLRAPLLLATLVTLALGLNPAWFTCVSYFMSDLGFVALCFGTVAIWVGGNPNAPTSRWLWTGIGLGLANLTRTAALPIIVITAMWVLWRVRRIGWLACGAFFLPVVAGVLLSKTFTAGGVSYGDNFRAWWPHMEQWHGYWQVMVSNLVDVLSGQYFWRTWWHPFTLVLYWFRARNPLAGACVMGVEALFFWGLLALVFRGLCRACSIERLVALLIVGYLGVVLVSPLPTVGNLTERYLFLTVPFAAHWAWLGLEPILALQSLGRMMRWLGVVISVVCVVAAGCWGMRVGLAHLTALGFWPDERLEAVAWLREHSLPEDWLAVGIDQPSMQLAAALGRPLVIDYFDAPEQAFLPIPLNHKVQGYAAAEFLLLPAKDERLSLPRKLMHEVLRTQRGNYRLLKVDSVEEKAWRIARGIPAPIGR